MSKTFFIKGKNLLNGEVNISGSKNCALCLIAGALLHRGVTKINNVPSIKDIASFLNILEYLNVNVIFNNNDLIIDTSMIKNKTLMIEDVSKFRASYYLIGALLKRFQKIEIARFGGCNFVSRPINYHIDMLTHFGVKFKEKEKSYYFELNENEETEYVLPYPSFGTTINALLFAVSLNKEITIKNICDEIEILHFVEFLKNMGANIILNSNNVYISPSSLRDSSFKNIPDRIETGTFLLMGPILAKELKVNNIIPLHNRPLLDLFSLLDIDYEVGEDYVILHKQEIKKSVFVETGIGDTISSDLQPLLSVFCLNIPRISVIKEKVYPSRFTHINPLTKMGAEIYESNHNILINGIMSLIGKEVVATDLRMAAAMIFAGLSANGTTIIHECDYIDRGYENIVEKLTNLGAEIKVYEES